MKGVEKRENLENYPQKRTFDPRLESGYEDENFLDLKYKVMEIKDEIFLAGENDLDLEEFLDKILIYINDYTKPRYPQMKLTRNWKRVHVSGKTDGIKILLSFKNAGEYNNFVIKNGKKSIYTRLIFEK